MWNEKKKDPSIDSNTDDWQNFFSMCGILTVAVFSSLFIWLKRDNLCHSESEKKYIKMMSFQSKYLLYYTTETYNYLLGSTRLHNYGATKHIFGMVILKSSP